LKILVILTTPTVLYHEIFKLFFLF
jgi:hypothetical protein